MHSDLQTTRWAHLLDDDGVLDVSVPCARCGYDLRTQPLDGRCPECGQRVVEVIDPRDPRAMRPNVLGRLRRTLLMLTAGSLAVGGALVLWDLRDLVAGPLRLRLWASPTAWVSIWQLLLGLSGLGLVVVLMAIARLCRLDVFPYRRGVRRQLVGGSVCTLGALICGPVAGWLWIASLLWLGAAAKMTAVVAVVRYQRELLRRFGRWDYVWLTWLAQSALYFAVAIFCAVSALVLANHTAGLLGELLLPWGWLEAGYSVSLQATGELLGIGLGLSGLCGVGILCLLRPRRSGERPRLRSA